MRISVITPVFNGEKYIRETITSVLTLISDTRIEYIVVDDGSLDNTSEILKQYSDKINVITQVNQGESAAVNAGLFNAHGDFVLVVSADDPLFTSEIFSGVEEYFDSNPNIVAWYPDWRMIDSEGNKIKEVLVPEYSEERLVGRFLCLPGPGTFFRKSAAIQIGGRRRIWKYVGDYDFWLRLSRVGELARREGVLAQWRFHDDSATVSNRGKEMYREQIGVIDDFLSSFQVSEKLSRMARSHALYFAAQLSFFSSEVNGRRTLFRALQARRGFIEGSRIRVVVRLLTDPVPSFLKKSIQKAWRN
jgi:glycosyltransferase involved in cell wall biosynthesis